MPFWLLCQLDKLPHCLYSWLVSQHWDTRVRRTPRYTVSQCPHWPLSVIAHAATDWPTQSVTEKAGWGAKTEPDLSCNHYLLIWQFNVALRPQRPYGLLGRMGQGARPTRGGHFDWLTDFHTASKLCNSTVTGSGKDFLFGKRVFGQRAERRFT